MGIVNCTNMWTYQTYENIKVWIHVAYSETFKVIIYFSNAMKPEKNASISVHLVYNIKAKTALLWNITVTYLRKKGINNITPYSIYLAPCLNSIESSNVFTLSASVLSVI